MMQSRAAAVIAISTKFGTLEHKRSAHWHHCGISVQSNNNPDYTRIGYTDYSGGDTQIEWKNIAADDDIYGWI